MFADYIFFLKNWLPLRSYWTQNSFHWTCCIMSFNYLINENWMHFKEILWLNKALCFHFELFLCTIFSLVVEIWTVILYWKSLFPFVKTTYTSILIKCIKQHRHFTYCLYAFFSNQIYLKKTKHPLKSTLTKLH